MTNINVIEQCQKFHNEIKYGFEKCSKDKNNYELIQAYIDLNETQIQIVNELFTGLAKSGPEKRKCY